MHVLHTVKPVFKLINIIILVIKPFKVVCLFCIFARIQISSFSQENTHFLMQNKGVSTRFEDFNPRRKGFDGVIQPFHDFTGTVLMLRPMKHYMDRQKDTLN